MPWPESPRRGYLLCDCLSGNSSAYSPCQVSKRMYSYKPLSSYCPPRLHSHHVMKSKTSAEPGPKNRNAVLGTHSLVFTALDGYEDEFLPVFKDVSSSQCATWQHRMPSGSSPAPRLLLAPSSGTMTLVCHTVRR